MEMTVPIPTNTAKAPINPSMERLPVSGLGIGIELGLDARDEVDWADDAAELLELILELAELESLALTTITTSFFSPSIDL